MTAGDRLCAAALAVSQAESWQGEEHGAGLQAAGLTSLGYSYVSSVSEHGPGVPLLHHPFFSSPLWRHLWLP
jgi:hypothetical protein